ncbi:efflux RND transporter periplasmic adaptor subunit [Pelagicoccus sp. SDUM812002]|uniref:efflux RND transporter periplasmic adaptor subunit n=1 Tax=Pelagicoccus sp. SDUM812002 TaxID=3041266 RepID=UPI00280D1B9F|nr:efflux RND transporter periplasmic adaptor subunit [Pelagicoccus sp. SDUM812002]MDQ8184641.1 efflux RND transporter periplasmic adaptor subunit [Pelagicoccus sp. SDUM812002]
MPGPKEKQSTRSKSVNWKLTAIVCLSIVLLAFAIRWLILSTEPIAQRTTASKRTPMLVETVSPDYGTFSPKIVVMGTVRAKNDVLLSPRVSGEIVEIAPRFEAGRFVQKGDILLKIDPIDYQNLVAQRRSALHQAEANLAMESGYQKVAQQDYELLGSNVSNSDNSLALREPQLKAARAEVEAAQAAVDQALLDLERTTIRAPFNAQVLSREVAVGSQISSSSTIARLVGADAYWVTATVPLDKLNYIKFSDSDKPSGSAATLRNRIAWPSDTKRSGIVDQYIGALDSTTRLARVNIEVADPLAMESGSDLPPLILDSLLEVIIEGKPIENVFRMDRSYLRQDATVWLKEDGELRITEVTVVFQDASHVYISEGLMQDADIVTTGLSSVVEGAALRTKDEPLPSDSE